MLLITKLIDRLNKQGINPDKIFVIISYLKKYGYLKSNFSIEDFLAAVRLFHSFFNIDKEELTQESLTLIETPRCGFPDILSVRTEESKWRKNKLTYCINQYITGLSQSEQNFIHEQVYKDWSNVCNITFTKVNGPSADIMISAGRGRPNGFDGPSGTLAWCELADGRDSPLNLKCDLDETWINNPQQRGILFKNVLQHENGHALGLVHSNIQTSLMAPYYNDNVSKPQQNDDIPRVQQYYGPPIINPIPKPTPVPTPVPIPTPVPTPTLLDKLTLKLEGNFNITEISIPGYRLSKLED